VSFKEKAMRLSALSLVLALSVVLVGCRPPISDPSGSPAPGSPAPGSPAPGSPAPGSPAPGLDACPNDLDVPEGFPPLGGACRTNIAETRSATYWPSSSAITDGLVAEDLYGYGDGRGARPLPDGSGAFDFGQLSDSDASAYFGILVPSLEPGRYLRRDGASIRDRLGSVLSEYSTDNDNGAVDVEIVGRRGNLVWGRFLARLCALNESCFHMNGRFSTLVEETPSDVPFGFSRDGRRDATYFCWDSAESCRLPVDETPACAVPRCFRRQCLISVPPNCV
jgi:hypothetical protein